MVERASTVVYCWASIVYCWIILTISRTAPSPPGSPEGGGGGVLWCTTAGWSMITGRTAATSAMHTPDSPCAASAACGDPANPLAASGSFRRLMMNAMSASAMVSTGEVIFGPLPLRLGRAALVAPTRFEPDQIVLTESVVGIGGLPDGAHGGHGVSPWEVEAGLLSPSRSRSRASSSERDAAPSRCLMCAM